MSIQESLWDHKLLPLVSTWDEILQEAEFVEASHQVKKEMWDKHRKRIEEGSKERAKVADHYLIDFVASRGHGKLSKANAIIRIIDMYM